jgi:tetratricopeptide (TPR) repeat protein
MAVPAPAESDRIVALCARIASLSHTAMTEAAQAASPFLGFAQKARIRALATHFESAGSTTVIVQGATRGVAVVDAAAGTAGLSREEIDQIVAHRVELLVRASLKEIGASPGLRIDDQVSRRVESLGADQEHRLLDYVKRHLTESLEMLESTLDERIAQQIGSAPAAAESERARTEARRDVEERLEEARESLLKNIDEVRTIDVGFDVAAFAGVVDMGQEDDGGVGTIEAAGDGEAVELGGEDEGLGDADDGVAAVEVGTTADAAAIAAALADEGRIELGLGDDDAEQTVGPGLAPADEAAPELSVDALESLDAALTAGSDDVVHIEIADFETAPDLNLDVADIEEISLIQPIAQPQEVEIDLADDDAKSDGDSDASLDEVADDDDAGLETLGEGPEDIDVADADEEGGPEVEIALDDDDERVDGEGGASIAKYLDLASQMRARKQYPPALELYSKVLELDRANYEALIGRGVLFLETKDYKRANDEFRAAEKVDPNRAAALLGLAEVHFHRKQFNKAISYYTQCLKLDDRLAQAYCNRGLSHYYMKNYKQAFVELHRAYDIDPELANIRKFLKLVKNKLQKEGGPA